MRRAVTSTSAALVVLFCASQAHAVRWMHWPTNRADSASRYISQGFYGDYISYCCASGTNCRGGCGTHNGYDYAVPSGTPLYAVAPGIVDEVHTTDTRGDYGNAGLYVRIRHDANSVSALGDDVFYSGYLHMSRIDVAAGDAVTTTTRIGLSGASGGVAAHLHLHLARDRTFCGAPVDPGCPDPPNLEGSVIPGFLAGSACEQRCDPNVENMWLTPASYGDEAYGGCMGLDYFGRCDGAVLHWCENGAPKTADCAETDRVCTLENDEVGYNCKPCDELGLPDCSDDGTTHSSCAAGTVVTEQCAHGCDPQRGCLPESPPPDMGSDLPDAGASPPPSMDMHVGTPSTLDADGPPEPDETRTIRGEGCCATPGRGPTSPFSTFVFFAMFLAVRRLRSRLPAG